MSGQYAVSVPVLHDLARQASGLAEQLGTLGQATSEASEAMVGDASLAAAIEEFNRGWVQRVVEMQADLQDAAEFLAAFADTSEGVDRQMGSDDG